MPASISSLRAADQVAVLVVFQRQLITGFDIDRAGFFVDDVLGDELADDVVERHQQLGDLPSSISFLTARGVTFLPASAITSPDLASTRS